MLKGSFFHLAENKNREKRVAKLHISEYSKNETFPEQVVFAKLPAENFE